MMIITLILIVIILLYMQWRKIENVWKVRGIKYVKPWPLFGNAISAVLQRQSLAELVEDLYLKYPNEPYYGIFICTRPILLIRDLDLAKEITIKKFDHFPDHLNMAGSGCDALWDRNIYSSCGSKWQQLRQALNPVFTRGKIKALFGLLDECARGYVESFLSHDKPVELEMKDFFSRFTNDAIAITALGVKIESYTDNEFLIMGKELTNFNGFNRITVFLYGNYPSIVKLLNLKIISRRVGNFFRSIIKDAIRVRKAENIIRPDLLHILMQVQKDQCEHDDASLLPKADVVKESSWNKSKRSGEKLHFDDDELLAQALIFYFSGFDSNSNLLCFVTHELATNPAVQERLRDEIAQIEGDITYEKLCEMKYLDMVVLETLRRWPQAVFLDRKCTKDVTLDNGLQLKTGDVCWIPLYGILHDEKYFPNPAVFDPERFSDENKGAIPPGSFMPFGFGKRNCIGARYALMLCKIMVFHLLSKFEIVTVERTQNPVILSKNSIFMGAEKGFWFALKPH